MVVEVEDAEALLPNLLNFGCATGGICSVPVEIEDGRFVVLRRCVPGSQCGAIGDHDVNFPEVIQASLHRRDSCWIGEIHEQAVAEKGYRANCGVSRDEPENERHNFLLH